MFFPKGHLYRLDWYRMLRYSMVLLFFKDSFFSVLWIRIWSDAKLLVFLRDPDKDPGEILPDPGSSGFE